MRKRIFVFNIRPGPNNACQSWFGLSRFALCAGHILFLLLWPALAAAQDKLPPHLIFNPITIQLDPSGLHTLTAPEIAAIAAGSGDPSGITNTTVTPATFTFCDVGQQPITLSLTDRFGNATNRNGPITVLAPVAPTRVYVDAAFPAGCRVVGFPAGTTNGAHYTGFDAFTTIQAAVDRVAQNGAVFVARGTYIENVVISRPLFLFGPNAGIAGTASVRQPEAQVIPARNDPENGTIIAIETDDAVIDGFLLNGHNSQLEGGYDANGVRVHASAGIQNGTYPDLADVAGVTVRNNIITNLSYDGICLDRYQYFGTASAWNYIRNNKLVNMWEGVLTYSLDSIITGNVISNVTHGLSVHCVTTASPEGFSPLVASNELWIAQWWPVEIQVARAPGIWINFRQENASPIAVTGNVIHTPAQAPALKTVIGLYGLTIDASREVQFVENTVDGRGNCSLGVMAADCSSSQALRILGGRLANIRSTGVLADSLDPTWGAADCSIEISNVDVTLVAGGVGVLALQESATPTNSVAVRVSGNSFISGGACGVQVRGARACASIVGVEQMICGNQVGVDVDGGRALIEGNILTNNQAAAITAENGAVVDAGDCLGTDLSGLGTGSGANGASAGANDLSGYGCDRLAPWAIRNTSTLPILADRNFFKLVPGERVDDVISGAVRFSDAGTLSAVAPPNLQVECIRQVPAAAKTIEEFVAGGGLITAGSANGITFGDSTVTNRPGYYTITRRYSLTGGCNQRVICDQVITARDDQPPTLHCSENIVRAVDKGCDYATITFTNLAADSCGELLGPWEPVSTGRFPIGTNTIIVIATDMANNSTACTFDVAVVGPPVITSQPTSRTNSPGTTASFNVKATSPAPMSYRWNRNATPLLDAGNVSGASTAELALARVSDPDAADYQVDVSNFAGTTPSAKAHLSLLAPLGSLKVIDWSPSTVTLEMSGPVANRFVILTSTNLADWVGLWTNVAPFILVHTNQPRASYRFYRAQPAP